jgi:hypothetical protein
MLLQLKANSSLPGLRTHKVGDFTSISANMSIRVLAHVAGEDMTLVHVGQHDAVYRWGGRAKPICTSSGRLLAIFQSDESLLPAVRSETKCFVDQSALLNAGVPPELCSYLMLAANEEELLHRAEFLAPEHQEAVLEAMYSTGADTFTINHPSNIIMLVEDEALAAALLLPFIKWRVYLHPKQRFVLRLPVERNILLKGGPGTGKTVTLVHRFIRLAAEASSKPPLFIAPNAVTAAILEEMLATAGQRELCALVKLKDSLPRSSSQLALALKSYSCVLVDEGQDLGSSIISTILEAKRLGMAIPPMCVAYDANQSIFASSGEAIERFRDFADVICLSYNYRSTTEIIREGQSLVEIAHKDFTGKNFVVQQQIESCRDKSTKDARSAISGPLVSRLNLSKCSEVEECVDKLLESGRLPDPLRDDSFAVLVVGSKENSGAWLRLKQRFESRCFVGEAKDVKGREFRVGCVIDVRDHDVCAKDRVTMRKYQSFVEEYVCVSRFREQLTRIELRTKGDMLKLDGTYAK